MTSTQPSLFEPLAHVRRTDPDTSEQAARKAKVLCNRHCQVILDLLRQVRTPMGAQEIADVTRLDDIQVARRWADLVRVGLVKDSGQRHRKRTGRMEIRYELTGGGV